MKRSDWLDAIVVGTVRAIETSQGAVDDDAAIRSAAGASASRRDRLVARAWQLAAPLGLPAEIDRWRAALPWLLAAAALLVAVLSTEVLHAVTGTDRRINAVGALLAVLTLPTLSLALWILSLSGFAPGGGGLSRWALALAAVMPGLRTPHGLRLVQATLASLRQARLLPWTLGLLNHLIWIGAFVLIVAGLLYTFAFRAYTLSWETTLLRPDFFESVITAAGWLPSQLGFPVPDAPSVRAANSPTGDQRPWAWWLVGCTVVYGLLPRLAAAALCLGVWQRRRPALGEIETGDPYFRKLIERFDRWDAARIVDPELAPDARLDTAPATAATADHCAVIGFELPPEIAWPPFVRPDPADWTQRIDGSADERREVLDRIARTRPARVLLVCHAASSPDRGTERFFRGALDAGAGGGLLLLGEGPTRRWSDWLADADLPSAQVLPDLQAARSWAEGGADV